MRSLKLVSLIAAVAVPLASAHAVTFSNIFINGVAAGSGNPTAFGVNGLSFSLPTNFFVGIGTSTPVELKYRVTASSGMLLDTFGVFPVGNTKNGNVSFTVDHINGGTQTFNYSQTSTTLASLSSNPSINLSPKQSFFDVVTKITLTGTETNSVNKLTIYNVSYTEAVPEPASMLAIAMGVGTFFARRRKGMKS